MKSSTTKEPQSGWQPVCSYSCGWQGVYQKRAVLEVDVDNQSLSQALALKEKNNCEDLHHRRLWKEQVLGSNRGLILDCVLAMFIRCLCQGVE